jgi:hypothetical protein
VCQNTPGVAADRSRSHSRSRIRSAAAIVYRVTCYLRHFRGFARYKRLQLKFRRRRSMQINRSPPDVVLNAAVIVQIGSIPQRNHPGPDVNTGTNAPVRCQPQRRHGSGIFRCIPVRRPVLGRSLANSGVVIELH